MTSPSVFRRASALCAAALFALTFAACGDAPTSPTASSTPTKEPSTSSKEGSPSEKGVTLTVTVEGTGVVRSEPAGITCPGQCSATFAPTTSVTLTTTPAEGWKLDGWSGCTGDASCSIVLDANVTVTSSLKLLDPRWDPSVGARDCEEAWGQAGEKLSPCDKTPDDYVVVHKGARNVALCNNGKLVKNFRSGLGFAPVGTKVKQGDGKTPEGVFYIPRLLPDSEFYKAFLFSYPTPADAQRGVRDGIITGQEGAQIESAHAKCTEPSQSTKLGGAVEIHGYGGDDDWTHGCVALDDSGVDVLWATIGVNDTIVVLP